MNYASDMKVRHIFGWKEQEPNPFQLGLYMKVPRRTLFAAQLTACILGSLTQSRFRLNFVNRVTDRDQTVF